MASLFAASADSSEHTAEITYANTGYSAYSDNTRVLPEEIFMTSMCIQTECTGYLPCVVVRFTDDANRNSRRYNMQLVRADGSVRFLYHMFENGAYIADYELLENEKILLSTADGSESIYIENHGGIFRVKANDDDIRSRDYDSGFVVYSSTGDVFPDDIEGLNICIRGNCSGPVESAMMVFGNNSQLAQMGYEAYVIRPNGLETDAIWVEEPGLLITDEKFTDELCVVFRSADQKHELYLSKVGNAINDSIPFKTYTDK